MIQILLFALFPIALAQYGHGGYGGNDGGYGGHGGYDNHYAPQPYKFGYDIKDHYGSQLNQREDGDGHGNKHGSYGFTDGHGIYRQVDYVADKGGFRATIKTNEPGTANQDPADVHISSSAPKIDHNDRSSYGGHGGYGGNGGYGGHGGNGGYGGHGGSSQQYLRISHNSGGHGGYGRSGYGNGY